MCARDESERKRETKRGREVASVWQATLEHLKCSAGHAITYISPGASAGTQRILSKVDERKTEKWKMENGNCFKPPAAWLAWAMAEA